MRDVHVRDYKFYMCLHWKAIPLPPPSMPLSPSADTYVEFSLENFLNKPVPGLVYDAPCSPTHTDAFTHGKRRMHAQIRRHTYDTRGSQMSAAVCAAGELEFITSAQKRPHTGCSLGAANVRKWQQ